MDHLVQRVVQTIQDLGIATGEALRPYAEQWSQRPVREDTSDEDMELASFLSSLYRAGVINRSQGRTLLAMLTERAPPPADDPYIGRRFGAFVAEELIGEGAMGKIYRATREGTLERDYVVKVFNSRDAAGVARFRREGQVMASLDHPNVIKVHGSGQEGQVPYLILEYVEGPTLQQMIEKRGRFSWMSATRAIKQIASALQAAHEAGVIHRDVKPENVLVARGGVLRVFDFGLAKTLDSKMVSQAGEILGSPAFMAPEQWGDHTVDARADLFATGVIYYLLICGQTPFRGLTPADYAATIQRGEFERADKVVPETPRAVADVICQLLEKDRARRTPTARVLLLELDRLLKEKPTNLPRLEWVDGEAERRLALVGKESFLLGSGPACDVQLLAAGVAANHAVLDRTPGGFVLRETSRSTHTEVNGNRVREIVLRDKDKLRLGEGECPALRFRQGNLVESNTARRRLTGERAAFDIPGEDGGPEPPAVVHAMLAAALEEVAHPRLLVSCFEAIDPIGAELLLDRTAARLRQVGFIEQFVSQARERAASLVQERTWRLVEQLFVRTKENLGRSVEAWLGWWLEMRGDYPRQFRAPGPRARGRLLVAYPDGSGEQSVDLNEGESWTIGRADEVEITVKERSVSRQHLTVHRLNDRFVFQDLGSRFGTTLNGQRHEVGFLRDQEQLLLGRARCLFLDGTEGDEGRTGTGSPRVEIDYHSFRALAELAFPATARMLVRLLDTPPLAEALLSSAAPHEDFTSVGSQIMTFLEDQRQIALKALPIIAQTNYGEDPAAWQAWAQSQGNALGVQVEPYGWGVD